MTTTTSLPPVRVAARIAALYLSLSVLWIYVSDRLLTVFTKDLDTLTALQTYKGWFFVLGSATLIFLLVWRHLQVLHTAQRSAEEALARKNAETESFVYSVSHDLKSPMITINSFIALLRQDLAAQEAGRVAKDIEYIEGAAEKMALLLNDLLELSRVGRVVNRPVLTSFAALVKESLAALAGPIAAKKVQVTIAQQQLPLFGDAVRLAQIWQNLLENAIKYMGEQEHPHIEIGVDVRSNQEPVFFVRDNGMGIDPVDGDRIFTVFAQLDGQSDGSGLGLAMVKRIVEFYQGRIWLESAGRGRGSCFLFTLPQALGPVEEIADEG